MRRAQGLKPRVRSFLEDAREDEEPDVVQEFTRLLNLSVSPNKAHLFIMVEEARQSGPGAGQRAARRQATRNLARQHCNS